MDKFLIVFRGSTVGEAEGRQHDPLQWESWFDSLGQALLDRGA